MEQVLCELQETVEDKIAGIRARMDDALESKEKVIFLLLITFCSRFMSAASLKC